MQTDAHPVARARPARVPWRPEARAKYAPHACLGQMMILLLLFYLSLAARRVRALCRR
jgi:hypothetical protein